MIDRTMVVALVGLVGLVSIDAAAARVVHRHPVEHRFVFATPSGAELPTATGFVGGYFGTGLLGASSADPYDRPVVGYDARGHYGPGSDYYRY